MANQDDHNKVPIYHDDLKVIHKDQNILEVNNPKVYQNHNSVKDNLHNEEDLNGHVYLVQMPSINKEVIEIVIEHVNMRDN